MKEGKSRKRQNESTNNGTCTEVENSTTPKSSSPFLLAPTRRRRRSAQVSKCPVCLKNLYKAVMSMAEINEHINRCYDAQFVVEKRKVVHERKKLRLDTKGNVITKGKEFGDTARSESLKCLQKGNTKEAFEYLLLKHLDP